MADSRDITGKNRVFTGTKGIKLPSDGSGTRVDEAGVIRFNTDINLAEYYDGTSWKAIDAPPVVSGISPTTFASDGSTQVTITISGSGFSNPPSAITFIGNDATEFVGGNITFVNSSTVTATTNTGMTVAKEPYDIKVTNQSGLAGTLAAALDAGSSPSFATASGNVGTISQGDTDFSGLSTVAATDADGQTVAHSISTGSLPPGVTFNSNGTFSGTVGTIASSTDYTFTVAATDGVNAVSRSFTITGTPPLFMTATGGTITEDGDYKVHTFTSSGTFTVSGTGSDATYGNKVEYLVVAGGGWGGAQHSGGGGAGGYRANGAYNFTVSATSYPITVGTTSTFSSGGSSTFATITSAGGGRGGSPGQYGPASGGSGGGGGSHGSTQGGASGNSPSVSPSQGNSGGGANSSSSPRWGGGGGGGAGGGGAQGNASAGGTGGAAVQNDITGSSLYYAGGGGGHNHNQGTDGGQPGTGQIGGYGYSNANSAGQNAVANRGGGGGGDHSSETNSGRPSSGVVILRYKFQ
jgi:hypothetical protein